MDKEIYVKIYTKDNNNILVFEGIKKDKDDYYYARGDIIGCGVTGKEHISITPEAKKLLKNICQRAKKTGDDLTCFDICKIDETGRIHLSWLGSRNSEIDIRKLDNNDFWIGTGEGYPDLSLIDEL